MEGFYILTIKANEHGNGYAWVIELLFHLVSSETQSRLTGVHRNQGSQLSS